MAGFGAQGAALVGMNERTNTATLQNFMKENGGISINPTATPWCAAYANSVLASEGFPVNNAPLSAQSFLNYGQAVDGAPQVGDVAVFTPGNTGISHVGVVTGFDSNGNPMVLQGNSSDRVKIESEDAGKLVFRRPVDADGKTPADKGAQPLSGQEAAGNGQAGKQGNQDGNTNTPGSNSAKAGAKTPGSPGSHKDIKGSPGNYQETNTSSIVSILPTHEPWPGHPKSKVGPRQAVSGTGGNSGSSGSANGSGTSTPGSGSSTGGTGGTIAPGKFTDKAPDIIEKLKKDFNLTDNQAAGIVGNLGHESGGFKFYQEQNPIGGGRGGAGWAQWTGPRRRAFEAWSAQNGLDTRSDDASYGFLKHELQTSEAGSIAAVKQTSTVEDATRAFEGKFERAGVKHYESRNNYARSALQAYNKKKANVKRSDNGMNELDKNGKPTNANTPSSASGGSSGSANTSGGSSTTGSTAASTNGQGSSVGDTSTSTSGSVGKTDTGSTGTALQISVKPSNGS